MRLLSLWIFRPLVLHINGQVCVDSLRAPLKLYPQDDPFSIFIYLLLIFHVYILSGKIILKNGLLNQ